MEKTKIAKFHYLTQDGILNANHVKLTQQACENGVKWIQLRMKTSPITTLPKRVELEQIAFEVRNICQKYKTTLVINDYVDITKLVNADGVHLGKNDMPVTEARKILGNEYIIGGTANTFEDILKLSNEKVDYIGLGPFKFTSTKNNLSPVLGIEGIENIVLKCKEYKIDIPIIAIGGINLEDVSTLLNTGVYGFAISGAINNSSDRITTLKKFLNSF
ncbi:MAG: thiamine-phosphate diphosphorylase [Bacteroidetes bacterium RIFCSPLOWO2_12_FULL_31_6]|nr:MAG: thiamine-phosphate diphosphorylase [Bacteroidetes bacterium RIFCSPLOWO2_12_FULL_31_6]